MVPSHVDTKRFALLVTVAAWFAAIPAPPLRAAVEAGASGECVVNTSSTALPNFCASSLVYEANKIVLSHIDMAQGTMRIKADRAQATGPNQDPLKNSTWVFTGNVEVWMPQGVLHADRAQAQIAGGRISSTSASGMPASFEQAAQPGRDPARGHAQDIHYDAASSDVQLTGNAWLSNGCNEISSGHIVYNMRSQRVQADAQSDGNQRIRGTIRPQCIPSTTGTPR